MTYKDSEEDWKIREDQITKLQKKYYFLIRKSAITSFKLTILFFIIAGIPGGENR